MTKSILLTLALLSVVLTTVHSQTCNPVMDCTGSTQCATSGGSMSCRCSYLKCKDFGTERCGGGCLTDTQCAQWAGGDNTCVCSWAFECERASMRHEPGYETYVKLMMAIKKDRIAERLAMITKEMKEQEDALDERLRLL
ncbi:uncharacterized protein LOC110863569 [Folsomia candida]|uniref:uncharacterized protein LOC110863569 n=1 Tax=Folsomia candida TaxID=158441 RepID=UPI000B9050B8|nr:uncharacterized protein LOC110863569 [Folsomia candida]